MRNWFNILSLFIFLFVSFVFLGREANAQSYLPIGPQTNVPENTVTGGGWFECYRDTYADFIRAEIVLDRCTGDRLLLSCRPTGSDTLTLLAQGERDDVTFDTGTNLDVTHVANGVGWYFNISAFGENDQGENAWGFVRAGDSVAKNNCDTDTSGANDERLCWHLQGDEGGYRCGAADDLNQSAAFERVVYSNEAFSRPIPTLSEWGLIAMAGILGLAGILVMRRKKAAA